MPEVGAIIMNRIYIRWEQFKLNPANEKYVTRFCQRCKLVFAHNLAKQVPFYEDRRLDEMQKQLISDIRFFKLAGDNADDEDVMDFIRQIATA